MSAFQSQVNAQPAPAVAGDFASANMNKYSALAGPGGIVTGPNGLYQARFAWLSYTYVDADSAPAIANNTGTGVPDGFVRRDQQALNTTFLSAATMLMPAGFPATLFNAGDFWAVNDGTTQAVRGMKAYARYADGKVTFAASGAPATAAATGSIAAGAGATVTGSISGNVLSVTAGTGLVVGGVISGSNVASGTTIVSQLSGTAGTIGTYAVSIPEQTVASTTITQTWGVFTAASALSGLFGVGDTLSGPGGSSDPVAAGTVITAFGTGTGGLGTYIVNKTQTSSSATVTAATSVETKWTAVSAGLPGEIVKMSSTS